MVAIHWRRAGVSFLAILCSTIGLSAQGGGQDARVAAARWPRVDVPDPIGAYVMHEALDKASALLADPGCGGLLADFRDRQGRPLADRLVALDVDIRAYAALIVFIDGSRDTRCEKGAVAFTASGSRVVRVCVDRLKETWGKDRAYTLAVVIHELLHTLGLGENPPSSKEITARVLARCWPPVGTLSSSRRYSGSIEH